jgi:hypothetical protein
MSLFTACNRKATGGASEFLTQSGLKLPAMTPYFIPYTSPTSHRPSSFLSFYIVLSCISSSPLYTSAFVKCFLFRSFFYNFIFLFFFVSLPFLNQTS